jgi:hypothetical protein
MIAASVLPRPHPTPTEVQTRPADPVPAPVAQPEAEPPAPHLSKLTVLRAVARKSTPHLIEATFVPAGLFYLCLSLWGVGVALAAALVWSYGALARRLIWHTGVPPILLLALVGLTARTVAAIFTGSTFVYFLLPILGTVAVSGLFIVSLFRSPLVGRLAQDFCPLTPEIASRPAVLRLFRGLTMLWAAVNLINAGATLLLLISLPLALFMAAKTMVCLVITVTGVVITVSWSVRTAHGEGLLHGGPTGLALEMRL